MTLELDTAAAAIVRDHPFVPRGEWWTVCGHDYGRYRWPLEADSTPGGVCGLAEAAHASTTLNHEPKEGTA